MFSIAASSRRAISRFADFEPAHLAELLIEIGGKLGTVGVQRVHLLGQDGPAAVDFDPALHRGLEHIQRLGQAPGRGIDLGLIGHRLDFGCAETLGIARQSTALMR